MEVGGAKILGVAARRFDRESDRGGVGFETHFTVESGPGGECGAAKNACYIGAMSARYRLGSIGDDELLAALSGLVRREHDLMSDLLAHLAELDERRLYLDLGFTSLFAYCTEALGFCKSSAARRIAVARTCRKYPEAFARVARGELQLSVLSLLGPHLNAENAAELFEGCRHQSCEQVELLLAARFPKSDVRDLIRRLPARPDTSTPHGGSGLEMASLPNGNVTRTLSSIRESSSVRRVCRASLRPPVQSGAIRQRSRGALPKLERFQKVGLTIRSWHLCRRTAECGFGD